MKKTSIRAIMMLLITLILLSSCQLENSKLEDEIPSSSNFESIDENSLSEESFSEDPLESIEISLLESTSEEGKEENLFFEQSTNYKGDECTKIGQIYQAEEKKLKYDNVFFTGTYTYSYKDMYMDEKEERKNDYDINYPIITNLEDKNVQDKINAMAKERSLMGMSEEKIKENVVDFWAVDSYYKIVFFNNEILTISFNSAICWQFASRFAGNTSTITFSIKTGDVIELGEFLDINEGFVDKVQNQIYEEGYVESDYVEPNEEFGEWIGILSNPWEKRDLEYFSQYIKNDVVPDWFEVGDGMHYINYYSTPDGKLGLIYSGSGYSSFYGKTYEIPLEDLKEFML